MKKISILVPTYNEKENVAAMADSLTGLMQSTLNRYDYEILFIDNCSTDGTRDILENICKKNKKIKAIFNVTNFGQFNSPFYGMCQTTGDCTVSLCCDFQDPPELIPAFVDAWEKGHKIVSGIKTASKNRDLFIFYVRVIIN